MGKKKRMECPSSPRCKQLNADLAKKQREYLNTPPRARKGCKMELQAIQGEIDEMHSRHRNRGLPAMVEERVWDEAGQLGLRLASNATGGGVVVKYMAADLPAEWPNLVGMALVEANGVDISKCEFDEVVSLLSNAGRP